MSENPAEPIPTPADEAEAELEAEDLVDDESPSSPYIDQPNGSREEDDA
jgi:hypothetical protein